LSIGKPQNIVFNVSKFKNIISEQKNLISHKEKGRSLGWSSRGNLGADKTENINSFYEGINCGREYSSKYVELSR